MSETKTNDIAGQVLSGTFSGEVHIASGADADAIAQQLLRDYGPPMANLKATMGTQQRLVELETFIRERFRLDDQERLIRQQETDQYRAQSDARMTRIEASANRSLLTSVAALLAAAGSWIRSGVR